MVTNVINNACFFFLGESGNGEMSKILLAPILRTKGRKRMFFLMLFNCGRTLAIMPLFTQLILRSLEETTLTALYMRKYTHDSPPPLFWVKKKK